MLDFYCPALRLCIELDGGIHDEEVTRQKDEDRTDFLRQNRIQVVRFKNEEVEQNIDNVLDRIRDFINTSINLELVVVQTPNPLT